MTASAPHGQCHCGAITWKILTPPPIPTANCHCQVCQTTSGSAYGTTSFLLTDAKGVEFTGTPKVFKGKSDAGNATQRGFCGDCGSVLFNHVNEGQEDEHWAIRTGGILTESPNMEKELFMRSKPSWVPSVVPENSQFETMPK